MMLVKGFVEISPPVKDEDTLRLLQWNGKLERASLLDLETTKILEVKKTF